ncbi:hypothetical protein HMPREF2532_02097 [Bacteroides ovatus]|nr:hypothetical protein HMPREF2532_02097 [Bacteroides ovatus]
MKPFYFYGCIIYILFIFWKALYDSCLEEINQKRVIIFFYCVINLLFCF